MFPTIEGEVEKFHDVPSNDHSAPLKLGRWQYDLLHHFENGFDLLGVWRRVAQNDLPG